MTKKKPDIKVTKLTEPFWNAVQERRFLLQYDKAADRYQFYPRPLSLFSDPGETEWREASGLGKLVACSRCHAPAPGFEGEVPYLLGLVALDEGPRVFAQIEGEEAPSIGARMRIAWHEEDGRVLYKFARA
ncbi:OB-fold domain-containing protein [Aquabacter sp. CN5-332]|uniref:Zn-ribbon domain-containing OB-fold protein n=1 Tax=Aquabacter sp. CN5-332 TaxID=3156608 RepID=UPI0032B4B5A7